jgi:hypothetical protein
MFRRLLFYVSKSTDKSPHQIFSRIDTIEKLIKYEDEIKEFIIEEGDAVDGVARVVVEIFGKVIRGRMRYKVGNGFIYALVKSPDIKSLEFGYIIENIGGGSRITQFTKFDMGSIIKNIFVLLFMPRKIKKHLEEEVSHVID